MPLTPTHIVELSRLLDEALTLSPEARDAWMDRLPETERVYVPGLREMLGRLDCTHPPPLLDTLPRLDWQDGEGMKTGDRIGPYRLLRPVGRGGMSVVWLAERAEDGVKRQVAIKLPLLMLNTERQLECFVRERDLLASLEHAHIARLYDAGVGPAGRPYLVLEYVADAVPLTRYCVERELPVSARLELFLQVLDAVAYAHAHLVVHRDLKPANIQVDAQGRVKLLDFGVAKLLPGPGEAGDQAATLAAGLALTPLYAAPEQLRGQPVTTATDVYALGVVLYELLTGRWPYAERVNPHSLSEVMQTVLEAEPLRPSAVVAPRGVTGKLAGDLDTIVLKALSKQPSWRYASAERFADDVRCFLNRQPIAARTPSWAYRAGLFARRYRASCVAAAVTCGVAVGLGAMTWGQYRQAVESRERAVILRDFMVGLVSDAEPDQHQPDQPVTALQMLDGAALRARSGYADKPRLQGELLAELGRMYLQLGEPALARPLLTDGLGLLTRHDPASSPALNQARALQAGLLAEYGGATHYEQATALASEAIRRCQGELAECARIRAEALDALALIQGNTGRFEDALPMIRRMAEEARIGYGATHSRTLQALNDAAVMARNTGLYVEAGRMVDELLAVAETQTLRAAVRTNILQLKARIDCDLGHYESARQRVEALIAQAPGHSGPALDDRGRSRANDQLVGMLRLLATVLLEQGDAAGAFRSANAAMALVRPEQRPDEVLYVRQVRVQAQALLTPHSTAVHAEALAVMEGLLGLHQPPDAIPVLRAHRVRGELLARSGHLEQARDALQKALGPAGGKGGAAVQRAVTLDQLGSVLRALGQPQQASQHHDAARALLMQALPAEHAYLARNAVYQALARQDEIALAASVAAYQRLFPVGSEWRRIVDRSLTPACRGKGQRSAADCLLLL